MAGSRSARAACLLLLCGALLAVGVGCSGNDAADRIRRRLGEVAERAERHDVQGVLAAATEGFRAEPGDRDREGVREVLALAFLRYGRFRILHPEPVVELARDGLSAAATVPFLVVRSSRSYPDLEDLYRDPGEWIAKVGRNADLYYLELHWIRTEEGWLVDSARLGSLGRSGVAE